MPFSDAELFVRQRAVARVESALCLATGADEGAVAAFGPPVIVSRSSAVVYVPWSQSDPGAPVVRSEQLGGDPGTWATMNTGVPSSSPGTMELEI